MTIVKVHNIAVRTAAILGPPVKLVYVVYMSTKHQPSILEPSNRSSARFLILLSRAVSVLHSQSKLRLSSKRYMNNVCPTCGHHAESIIENRRAFGEQVGYTPPVDHHAEVSAGATPSLSENSQPRDRHMDCQEETTDRDRVCSSECRIVSRRFASLANIAVY